MILFRIIALIFMLYFYDFLYGEITQYDGCYVNNYVNNNVFANRFLLQSYDTCGT